MELRRIGMAIGRHPVGGIPPTTLENEGKMFIIIDPTVGSLSNFFHEFLEVVSDGIAWNLYDPPTASDRGHYTDSAREQGQMVHN